MISARGCSVPFGVNLVSFGDFDWSCVSKNSQSIGKSTGCMVEHGEAENRWSERPVVTRRDWGGATTSM